MFSVLMSVYDGEKPSYLEQSLGSLLGQTFKADEVVLVEDGPISSELKAVIELFRESLNIVSVPLDENVGLACALNEGLKYCSHELVARMDTDDIALPDRFATQVAFMQANSDIAASGGFIEEFNNNAVILSRRELPVEYVRLIHLAKKRSPLSHVTVFFQKKALIAVGGYPDHYPEDYLLWIKLLQAGYKIANIPEVLVRVRIGESFISRRGLKFLKGEVQIYNYMYKTGFITFLEYCSIVFIKSIVRLSPGFIKIFLYKVAR